jgi:Gas vesicle synthesis protein GvpL/GvpF
VIHLYAVCDPLGVRPSGVGLAGRRLEAIEEAGVAAVFSRHEERLEATEERLWAHEGVVEALMEHGAVLPARYGDTFAGERELRAALRARSAALAERLNSVRGHVELAVRVLRSDGAEPSSGRSYLEERHRQERHIGALHESLAALASAAQRSAVLGRETVHTGSYLVRAEDVPAFVERAASLHRSDDLDVFCTGPWPPYSFAAEQEDS